ncbi:MAG: SDR family oxidoreductase [Prolixibacteraceae bacterium]|jgi:NAD(P)-dependent dehydrogenase (short-subunit alcohol dehydrogenase family)|nr:SDR family oxidoreductase [Prolixibacteraceae bacterium]
MISTNELLGLEGKTAVVTGAGGVICSRIAEGLCEVGMNVMLLDIDEARAIENAKMLKEKFPTQVVEGFFANVLDKRSLESAKTRILSFVDAIDYIVNGAGGNSPKATTQAEQIIPGENNGLTDFFDLEMEGFDHVFNLNFKGTILPTMVFGKDMIERGTGGVLNISSMNAFSPLTKIPAYSAAKSSINNFTQWLAVHFAKTGVRVNAIAPGFFLTTQNKFLLLDEEGNPTERGQKIINNTPMGRYGEIEELVGTSVYLLSNMAKFVTGIVVPIDGGFSAYSGV